MSEIFLWTVVVFFLKFANQFNAKKVAYAASFSVESIPADLKTKYKGLIENMDAISVRELSGLKIISQLTDRNAELVLDPTLLLQKKEWISMIGNKGYATGSKGFVLIYTLSGSKYIYCLAKSIGKKLNTEVVNIKNGYVKVEGEEGIKHLYNVGPREFISLFSHAVYVITDSFHGTAFSINFNIPFTALLNPVSNLNSRVLSLLQLTNTMDRMIYDNGENRFPESFTMDFESINTIVNEYRTKSMNYIQKNILS